MQLKTILNRICVHPGFVFGKIRIVDGGEHPRLDVDIRHRAKSSPVCSGCGKKRVGYDTLPVRRFQFVPMWGFLVFFLYAMRRVDCPGCGIIVEKVPWSKGKHRCTTDYQWFLAKWAKRMSWKEVAEAFWISWDTVFRAVEMAVEWGMERRNLDGITAIGLDEVLWHRGHHYLTVVYQIDQGCRRLLWVGRDRTVKTTLRFFRWFGKQRCSSLTWVCSDMWKPYLKVIAKKVPWAIHILDRFHIVKNMNKAIDETRAKEAKTLIAKGLEPVLKGARWCLLKRPGNLTIKQAIRLAELLQFNLRAVRAYILKEQFQFFWEYKSPYWAGRYLDTWCQKTMRSRIEPMKKIARQIRSHRPLILNWFRAKGMVALGAVEGLNNKLKLVIRRAYGFKSFRKTEVALYHTLGDLPEPEVTHKFCG